MYIIAEAEIPLTQINPFFYPLRLSILIIIISISPQKRLCAVNRPAPSKKLTRENSASSFLLCYFSTESTLALNRLFSASEGMRKPFLGETEKSSMAGPSIRQLLLNCCEK